MRLTYSTSPCALITASPTRLHDAHQPFDDWYVGRDHVLHDETDRSHVITPREISQLTAEDYPQDWRL